MINMNIFATVLECAYNLKVERNFTKIERFYTRTNGHGFVHTCDIKTNKGGLHITLDEGHFKGEEFVVAEIKTSITTNTPDEVAELVKLQMENESFFTYGVDNNVKHEVVIQ